MRVKRERESARTLHNAKSNYAFNIVKLSLLNEIKRNNENYNITFQSVIVSQGNRTQCMRECVCGLCENDECGLQMKMLIRETCNII